MMLPSCYHVLLFGRTGSTDTCQPLEIQLEQGILFIHNLTTQHQHSAAERDADRIIQEPPAVRTSTLDVPASCVQPLSLINIVAWPHRFRPGQLQVAYAPRHGRCEIDQYVESLTPITVTRNTEMWRVESVSCTAQRCHLSFLLLDSFLDCLLGLAALNFILALAFIRILQFDFDLLVLVRRSFVLGTNGQLIHVAL